MTVYVDPAVWPFRRMVMCHMWADTEAELMAMADAIGVGRHWVQRPPKASWLHFDICKSKRVLAVRHGAVETDRFGALEWEARRAIASGAPDLMARGEAKLALLAGVRERRQLPENPSLFDLEP